MKAGAQKVSDSLEQSIEVFANPNPTSGKGRGAVERRAKTRVNEPFPARIWGVDSGDLPFNIDCVLDNISATGLYLRVPRELPETGDVRLIVHLLSGPTTGASASIVGKIVRTDPQPDGRHGIAIAIKRHRFL